MKVHVHWMNLMKFFQSFEVLNERAARQRVHFKNYLIKKYVQWVQNV